MEPAHIEALLLLALAQVLLLLMMKMTHILLSSSMVAMQGLLLSFFGQSSWSLPSQMRSPDEGEAMWTQLPIAHPSVFYSDLE